MSWTDERVELLKKLWMDGLSASQIAKELGEGVTRNAVIGKVHRLKLSARAKPQSTATRTRVSSRPAPRRASAGASSGSSGGATPAPNAGAVKRRVINTAPVLGATALKPSEELEYEPEVVTAEVQELYIPEADRKDLLSLNENTCKWPIGDPLSPDFYFCGRPSEEGKPYCEFHSRRAYHQLDRKRR